ncbi:MAG: tetratricopeptide repeat protein [Thermodesulfobacteriota bacterium]
MSLITDLLSKVSQTEPRKDVPPGLTNSINAYKKKERTRARALLISFVAVAALVCGIATIYALRLFVGTRGGEVRPSGAAQEMAAQDRVAAAPVAVPAAVATPPAQETRQARKRPSPAKRARKKAGSRPPARVKGGSKGAGTAPVAALTGGTLAGSTLTGSTLDGPGPAGQASPEAMQHYYEALDYEKQGELGRAAQSYSKALRLEPRNYRLMNKIASIYMEMGMWEEAAASLGASVRTNDGYVPALINTGIVYAELGRFKVAEAALKKALSIEPYNGLALFNTALLYERQAMPEEAAVYYKKLQQTGDPLGEQGLERIGAQPGLTVPTPGD